MTIEEVVQDYIRETVKPLTPDQARIKALQSNVDRARLALQTARDQQRQRRESERRAKASQTRAAITTSLKHEVSDIKVAYSTNLIRCELCNQNNQPT
jgi:hypothetical protein